MLNKVENMETCKHISFNGPTHGVNVLLQGPPFFTPEEYANSGNGIRIALCPTHADRGPRLFKLLDADRQTFYCF